MSYSTTSPGGPLHFRRRAPPVSSSLEPFGPGNPNPVFASTQLLAVPGSAREVGNGHLKIRLVAADSLGPAVEAIGFGLAGYLPRINEGHPFDACYTLEMNEYRGSRHVQLRLLDIRWA